MFLVCAIRWNQMLSPEWGCSWNSANRRYSNYIWVMSNVIDYKGVPYIRGLTVYSQLIHRGFVTWNGKICGNIGSGNALLPGGIKPLPEPMLHCSSKVFRGIHIRAVSQEVVMNLSIRSRYSGILLPKRQWVSLCLDCVNYIGDVVNSRCYGYNMCY